MAARAAVHNKMDKVIAVVPIFPMAFSGQMSTFIVLTVSLAVEYTRYRKSHDVHYLVHTATIMVWYALMLLTPWEIVPKVHYSMVYFMLVMVYLLISPIHQKTASIVLVAYSSIPTTVYADTSALEIFARLALYSGCYFYYGKEEMSLFALCVRWTEALGIAFAYGAIHVSSVKRVEPPKPVQEHFPQVEPLGGGLALPRARFLTPVRRAARMILQTPRHNVNVRDEESHGSATVDYEFIRSD